MSTKITFVGLDGDVESALIDASSEDEGPSGTDGVVINISSLTAEWDSTTEKWDLSLTVSVLASDDSLWEHWHYAINSTFSESGAAGGYMVMGGGLTKVVSSVSPGSYSFAVAAVNGDHEVVSNIDISTIVLPSDGSAYTSTAVLDGEETVSVNLEALAESLDTPVEDLVDAIIASTSVDTETTAGTPLVGGKTYYKNAETIVTSQVANSWFGGERNQPSSIGLPVDDPKVIGIVHDGNLSLDGHAEKIMLTRGANIRGKLPHANLSAQGDVEGAAVFKQNVKTWPEAEYIGKAIPEIEPTTGEYYLDLSLLRADMEGMGGGAFEEYPDFKTTLYEYITDSQTEITLTDGSNFPDSGGYIQIDEEYIFYSGKTGADILTGCTRGLGSFTSTASEHYAGDVVTTISEIVKTKNEKYNDIGLLPFKIDERKDFVFGSNSTELDITKNALQTNKFLFDKHIGAFRAGTVTSNDWNSPKRGYYSAGFGYNGVASGYATFTGGNFGRNETNGSFLYGTRNRIWEGASQGQTPSSTQQPTSFFSYSNTITGGEYNDIYNGFSSGILSGALSWADFVRSSAIASGEKNWIRGSCDEKVRYSFIGSGYENTVNFTDGAGIVAGNNNLIGGDSEASFIGAGTANTIITNEDSDTTIGLSKLFENRDKLLLDNGTGVLADRFECEDEDGKGRSERRYMIRQGATSYLGSSIDSFIGAGNSNTIANANMSFVGGGKYNLIVVSEGSSILGGRANSIEPYIFSEDKPSGPQDFSLSQSDYVSILGGRDNWIMADAGASTILGGVGNSITESEAGLLFGKDNIARKTPNTSALTRFTKTTGYAAKSNLYGQHSHASGGFYSFGGKRAKSASNYPSQDPDDIRKIIGYTEESLSRAGSGFFVTKESSQDTLLSKVKIANSNTESEEAEISLATGKNREDAFVAGQAKFAKAWDPGSQTPDYEDIWSTNANMHIGSAQTSVLTMRREVTPSDLLSQPVEQIVLDVANPVRYSSTASVSTGRLYYEFNEVDFKFERDVNNSYGPRYLIFTRVLDEEEKNTLIPLKIGGEDTYDTEDWLSRWSRPRGTFQAWYHSTGGEGDSNPLKNSQGQIIPMLGDYSELPNRGARTISLEGGSRETGFTYFPWTRSYPRQYAKNHWFQLSDSHIAAKYRIPAVGFRNFNWGWLDTLLDWSEDTQHVAGWRVGTVEYGTLPSGGYEGGSWWGGGARSVGGLNFNTGNRAAMLAQYYGFFDPETGSTLDAFPGITTSGDQRVIENLKSPKSSAWDDFLVDTFKTDPVLRITNAFTGNFVPTDAGMPKWDEGRTTEAFIERSQRTIVDEEINGVKARDRIINFPGVNFTTGDGASAEINGENDFILHPCGAGTVFRKLSEPHVLNESTGEAGSFAPYDITITEEMFNIAADGGDGYFYTVNADGEYTFYYRCIDMKYDLGEAFPSIEAAVAGTNDPRGERTFASFVPGDIAPVTSRAWNNVLQEQREEIGIADTFERLRIASSPSDSQNGEYFVKSLYIPSVTELTGEPVPTSGDNNPEQPPAPIPPENPNPAPPAPVFNSSEFELFLSDPEYSQVLEIEPYSVWSFSISAVVTTHNTSYINSKMYTIFGGKKGAFRTAVMKACGGIAYPGLHGGSSNSRADLQSAVVFSNKDNGFDKNAYRDGAPHTGANLPITVGRGSGHYMDNYMADDEDPGFYLKVDAGSTSVPFGAPSILPSHKDYLRIIIGTNVPCRVVARVELTQLAGAESTVENTIVQGTEEFEQISLTDVLDKATDRIEDSTFLDLEDYEIETLRSRVDNKKIYELSSDTIERLVAVTDAADGASLVSEAQHKIVTTTSIAENIADSGLNLKGEVELETALIENFALNSSKSINVLQINQNSASGINQSTLNLQNQLEAQATDNQSAQQSSQQEYSQFVSNKASGSSSSSSDSSSDSSSGSSGSSGSGGSSGY